MNDTVKLIIEMPKQVYELCKTLKSDSDDGIIGLCAVNAIANGTPLPKGHGKLIDAGALKGHGQIQIVPCGNGKYVEVMTYYQDDIDNALTIIEADTAESEDKYEL